MCRRIYKLYHSPIFFLLQVSLLKLAEITEDGVTFKSPIDGSEMLLTPEQSIQCQNEIGIVEDIIYFMLYYRAVQYSLVLYCVM